MTVTKGAVGEAPNTNWALLKNLKNIFEINYTFLVIRTFWPLLVALLPHQRCLVTNNGSHYWGVSWVLSPKSSAEKSGIKLGKILVRWSKPNCVNFGQIHPNQLSKWVHHSSKRNNGPTTMVLCRLTAKISISLGLKTGLKLV